MAYADLNTLLARAGRVAPAWTEETDPDLSDLEVFLANAASEIDAELQARQISLPLAAEPAAALAGLNADGALIVALEATFPDARGGLVSGMALLEGARARWDSGLAALRDGTHTVVRWLETTTAAGQGASSFWDSEAQAYGVYSYPSEWEQNPPLAPAVFRNERG